MQGNATISIQILHENAIPWPPCDKINTQEELFMQPIALQVLDDVPKARDTNMFGERVKMEKNIAFDRDPLNLSFRTQILHSLSQFNFSTLESYPRGNSQVALACSSMVSFDVTMRTITTNHPSVTPRQNGLDLALFAYDPDEDKIMQYVIIQAPKRGKLIFQGQDLHDEKVCYYYYGTKLLLLYISLDVMILEKGFIYAVDIYSFISYARNSQYAYTTT